MKNDGVREILSRFADCTLVVLGDFMLDHFIWGTVRRISPEAPVPVVEVGRESYHLGGAGNVVANVVALGARVIPVAIIGEDWAGAEIRRHLNALGVRCEALICDHVRPTTLKTRIVAHNQQVVRADREDRSAIDAELEESVIGHFNDALREADAVVISDYDKGLLTPHVLDRVLAAARERGKPVCLDPKIRNFALYHGVDVLTPNQLEAERATGIEIVDDQSLLAAAERIRYELSCKNLLITRGEHGMSLLDNEGHLTNIATVAREVYDVTGAGDTVLAALALSLAAGASVYEAAVIANHAAGVVVAKVGTATVSREELEQTL